MLTSWKFWLGSALLLGLIWLVEEHYGWLRILDSWRAVPPQQLAIGLLLMLVSYLLRAVRFHDFFATYTRGSFLPLLRITVLHNFFNNLLPMRSGEASFPLLMKQRYGIPYRHSTPALLWLRLLDLYVLLALAFISLQTLTPWGVETRVVIAVLVLMAPMLALLLQQKLRIYLAGGTGWKATLHDLMVALPDHPLTFARALLWTVINWALKLAVFAWLLSVFTGLPLSSSWSGATTGELSSVLPIHGLAGAGTYEAGVMAGLLPWGIEKTAALAAAVNLHLFVLGSTFILTGLLVVLTHGVNRGFDEKPVE
ncbi:lysylphosphatidylglycerol synthase transmembrane domain-containing protein [Thalassolituus maritimus]|uniref:Lysylphosphatidylglycerol synthase domain-containing protein n=1 Tax=Thalassolituus maritimus TaxID=484498 RepID=A0ABP9ZYU0_9GAMM